MSYNIYKTQFESAKNSYFIVKDLKRIYGSSYSFSDYINRHKEYLHLYEEGLINLGNDNPNDLIRLMHEEVYWESKGRKVVFIEDKQLFNDLKKANINYKSFNGVEIDFPYNIFSISFPKGSYISGNEIKSCLVSIMSGRELLNVWDNSNTEEDIESLDSTYINLYFTLRNNDTKFLRFDTKYLDSLNENNNLEHNLLRFVLALFAYHSATEGEKLVKGFPKSCIVVPKNKKINQYSGLKVEPINKKKTTNKGDKKIKYRMPFFRNLRSDRYYKGKYKEYKKGSRWVFIKELNINNAINSILK